MLVMIRIPYKRLLNPEAGFHKLADDTIRIKITEPNRCFLAKESVTLQIPYFCRHERRSADTRPRYHPVKLRKGVADGLWPIVDDRVKSRHAASE
jgi:hypothetical protein